MKNITDLIRDSERIAVSSADSSGETRGLRQGFQSQHCHDAESRSDRQERERPSPAEEVFEQRYQPDRRNGENKADGELQRESASHIRFSF